MTNAHALTLLREPNVLTSSRLRNYYDTYPFTALNKTLSLTPSQIVEEIKISGLRGRGGAAFPTGLKWQSVMQQSEPIRYVVANGEEGEPGTFKDRVLLESNPLALIEAMLIAIHTVKAHEAYIFLNHSYTAIAQALTALLHWLEQDRATGRFAGLADIPIYIRTARQRYIAGEETALFRALEGQRAEPSSRPPYPTEQGLWHKPTIINNIETLACIPLIIENGGAWFASLGPADSHGPKLYSVTGDVKRAGVYEAIMSITLRELIEQAGGLNGEFKGAMIGGPSGRLLDATQLDLPLSIQHGAGNGTVIVFNTTRCAVDLARHVTDFFYQEHCGQCLPGRTAMRSVKSTMDSLEQRTDLTALRQQYLDLHGMLLANSKCGLCSSGTAMVPALLQAYPQDFLQHVQHHCALCTGVS